MIHEILQALQPPDYRRIPQRYWVYISSDVLYKDFRKGLGGMKDTETIRLLISKAFNIPLTDKDMAALKWLINEYCEAEFVEILEKEIEND